MSSPHPPLAAAMRQCPLVMRYGLPQDASELALVCKSQDVPDAVSFLRQARPSACITGMWVPDMNPRKKAVHIVDDGTNMPLYTLDAVQTRSSAMVILYAPLYCGYPWHITDGFVLAQQLASRGIRFFLTPKPDQSHWYTRHYPDIYEAHGPELEKTYALLADGASRQDFAAVVQALVTGQLGYLTAAPYQQYEHPLVHVRPGDYVIDGGMCSLEDTRRFAAHAGAEGLVLGFEPEPEQFARIQKELAEEPSLRIKAFQAGLGAESKDCSIVCNGAGSWLTAKDNPVASPCRVVDVDSFVAELALPKVNIIKMDIEGCELDALRGAAETIRTFKPRLMISAYHKKEDLFTIPSAIHALCPEYALYFTSHYMLTGEYMWYACVDKAYKTSGDAVCHNR